MPTMLQFGDSAAERPPRRQAPHPAPRYKRPGNAPLMERIDPTGCGPWERLDEADREYYRTSIREILLEKTLLARAMGCSLDSPTIAK